MDLLPPLLKYLRVSTEYFGRHCDQQIAAGKPPFSENSIFRYPALSAAVLYKLDHPANELRGQTWLRDMALRLLEGFLEGAEESRYPDPGFVADLQRWGAWRYKQPWTNLEEWQVYAVLETMDLLGPEMPEPFRRRGRVLAAAYVNRARRQPFFYTAANHEAWRCLTIYRAGHLFQEPEWCELGLNFLRQLLTVRTPEGFWEETMHHGPSMQYNYYALVPLAWLYRLTGQEWIGEPARKLARFIGAWVFPDGTSIGAFDGRRPSWPGAGMAAAPGLELDAQSAPLIGRLIEVMDRRGMLDQPRRLSNSSFGACYADLHTADAVLYYSRYGANTTGPLPVDAPGATLQNHTAHFDAVLARRGPWALAVSGQRADMPKEKPQLWLLERQSRLEVWHEQTGTILGGGHNRIGTDRPLANVLMDPAWAETTVEFGRVSPSETDHARALYIPRACESSAVGQEVALAVHFAHGSVRWRLQPAGDRELLIHASWETFGLRRMCLQLPVVIWQDGRLEAQEEGGRIKTLLLRPPKTDATVRITLPDLGTVRLHRGFVPMRSYVEAPDDHLFDSPYSTALLCHQLEQPGSGQAQWRLRIE